MARAILSHLPPSSIPERSSIGAERIEAALVTALSGIDWAHDLAAPLARALAPVYADGVKGGAAAVAAALAGHPHAVPKPAPAQAGVPTAARPIRPAPHPAAPAALPPGGGAAGDIPGAEPEAADTEAMAWARDHAAKLVTRIEENTRALIRAHVVAGLAEGDGAERLADRLRHSPGFSHARALLIARTELQNAQNHGNLAAYRRSGAVWGKEWLLDGDPCEVCIGNADAGPIPLDQPFPSGDQAPTAHPRCVCALGAVIAPPTRH